MLKITKIELKKVLLILSVFCFFLGNLFLLTNDLDITGAFIGTSKNNSATNAILAITSIFLSYFFLVESFRLETTISNIINVSDIALKKLEKEKFVKINKKEYLHEILEISKNPLLRHQEKIGDFRISPRGHKKIRVAWHIENQNNNDKIQIYIDDFLYHKGKDYNNKWNELAESKEITKEKYTNYQKMVLD